MLSGNCPRHRCGGRQYVSCVAASACRGGSSRRDVGRSGGSGAPIGDACISPRGGARRKGDRDVPRDASASSSPAHHGRSQDGFSASAACPDGETFAFAAARRGCGCAERHADGAAGTVCCATASSAASGRLLRLSGLSGLCAVWRLLSVLSDLPLLPVVLNPGGYGLPVTAAAFFAAWSRNRCRCWSQWPLTEDFTLIDVSVPRHECVRHLNTISASVP